MRRNNHITSAHYFRQFRDESFASEVIHSLDFHSNIKKVTAKNIGYHRDYFCYENDNSSGVNDEYEKSYGEIETAEALAWPYMTVNQTPNKLIMMSNIVLSRLISVSPICRNTFGLTTSLNNKFQLYDEFNRQLKIKQELSNCLPSVRIYTDDLDLIERYKSLNIYLPANNNRLVTSVISYTIDNGYLYFPLTSWAAVHYNLGSTTPNVDWSIPKLNKLIYNNAKSMKDKFKDISVHIIGREVDLKSLLPSTSPIR